jgi:collagenase-like PrtC family protease
MQRKIRTRYAPSPTGFQHIGGVRTALYCYLFAKKHGGDFILRIEDTDQTRYVAEAEQYIIDSLNWLGIQCDEGVHVGGNCAPYRQSERKSMYRQYADRLVENGYAYYAFDGLWISDEGLLGYVSYVTPSFKIFYQPLRPLSNFSQIVFWQNQGAERLLLSPPLIYSEIATFQKNSRIPLELLIYQDSLDLFAELKIIKETGVKSLRLDLKTLSIDLFAVQIKKFRQAVDELYLVQNLFDFENE